LEQGVLDLGQSLPLELLRGPLDLIESLALALELVDPLLGARDRISFVVLEDETDVGHGIFISFFGSLVAKQRANSTNLPCHSIPGKWTGGKFFKRRPEQLTQGWDLMEKDTRNTKNDEGNGTEPEAPSTIVIIPRRLPAEEEARMSISWRDIKEAYRDYRDSIVKSK
jgi:hypothetical protein